MVGNLVINSLKKTTSNGMWTIDYIDITTVEFILDELVKYINSLEADIFNVKCPEGVKYIELVYQKSPHSLGLSLRIYNYLNQYENIVLTSDYVDISQSYRYFAMFYGGVEIIADNFNSTANLGNWIAYGNRSIQGFTAPYYSIRRDLNREKNSPKPVFSIPDNSNLTGWLASHNYNQKLADTAPTYLVREYDVNGSVIGSAMILGALTSCKGWAKFGPTVEVLHETATNSIVNMYSRVVNSVGSLVLKFDVTGKGTMSAKTVQEIGTIAPGSAYVFAQGKQSILNALGFTLRLGKTLLPYATFLTLISTKVGVDETEIISYNGLTYKAKRIDKASYDQATQDYWEKQYEEYYNKPYDSTSDNPYQSEEDYNAENQAAYDDYIKNAYGSMQNYFDKMLDFDSKLKAYEIDKLDTGTTAEMDDLNKRIASKRAEYLETDTGIYVGGQRVGATITDQGIFMGNGRIGATITPNGIYAAGDVVDSDGNPITPSGGTVSGNVNLVIPAGAEIPLSVPQTNFDLVIPDGAALGLNTDGKTLPVDVTGKTIPVSTDGATVKVTGDVTATGEVSIAETSLEGINILAENSTARELRENELHANKKEMLQNQVNYKDKSNDITDADHKYKTQVIEEKDYAGQKAKAFTDLHSGNIKDWIDVQGNALSVPAGLIGLLTGGLPQILNEYYTKITGDNLADTLDLEHAKEKIQEIALSMLMLYVPKKFDINPEDLPNYEKEFKEFAENYSANIVSELFGSGGVV